MIRFQNYINDVAYNNSDIEVVNSIFSSLSHCAIRIERKVELNAKYLKFQSCYENIGMIRKSEFTPSTIGFDGKRCQIEFIDIFDCNASNACQMMIIADIYANLKDISQYLGKSYSFTIQSSFGPSSVENINQSYLDAPFSIGSIHFGYYPAFYKIKYLNLYQITSKIIYAQSNSKIDECTNCGVNIVNCSSTDCLLASWRKKHLFDSFAVFDCSFIGNIKYYSDDAKVRFVNCFGQDNFIMDEFVQTEKTTFEMKYINVTINPRPYVYSCRIRGDFCQHSFTKYLFVFILI